MKTTLDSDGRIQLPSEIQTQLGLKPGDDVILETDNRQCVIRPDEAAVGLCPEGNVLVHRGVSDISADAVLVETRDGRLNQLTEGLSG